ncbi:MAG: bifunctional folylpolyglutamate synthase/dihydrofolate synthase [Alphaproteobacteria bacterium]|nr:bifunctional folylpolyglutamate synthase/dihydrofolate synthase [Alphaproteobacteria bacterium]
MYTSDVKHPDASLEEKLQRLFSLNRGRTIDLSFRRPYLELLRKFGDPHKNLPPVIHVAGTNGKGSIVATLRSILEAAGYKVHAYISPHLCAFNERIYLAGRDIENSALEDLIDEALDLNDGEEITFFEITTAMAFAAFARMPADILLLEVGMGGRLDCTNVIENPLVTIISSIGLDHVEYLGDSFAKIAAEKAGIMKKHVPCIIGAQSPEALRGGVMEVFVNHANVTGAELFTHGAEWSSETGKGRMHFVFKPVHQKVEKLLPPPNLLGLHQAANSGAALAALQIIASKFPVSDAFLEKGLQNIDWPARLQNLTERFLVPRGWEIWLDGGHNEDAAQALAAQALLWKNQDGKKLHLVMGMLDSRDPRRFIEPLLPYLGSITAVSIPGETKAFLPADLAKAIKITKPRAADDYKDALEQIMHSAEAPGRILVAGSLYLAGHVLKTCGNRAHNKADAA